MQPRNERQFLADIAQAVDRIETYTSAGEATFHDNEMIQDAVIRQLGIIGEAARHLSKETKDLAPEIPWRDVVDTRNFLIHAYALVDLDAVWDTVQELGTLKEAIDRLSSS